MHIVTAAVFGILAGVGSNREWNNWDLLRYHVSFGATDPEYHKDVGFYVFELPFIKFLLGWTFEAMIVVLIVTLVAHYLNGGIQLQGPTRRVTSAVKTPRIGPARAVGPHQGVSKRLRHKRFELVLSRSHVVNGATATSVHANKPALTLLIAIAVIAAGLFLYNIRQKGWTLPVVAVGLWVLVDILVGGAYPALYQALRVNPSELTRESPYIQRNINATRAAYGLNTVQVDNAYNYTPTVTDAEIQGTSPQAQANQQTLANVRLLDPAVSLLNTFDKYQALRSYYSFSSLTLDRYTVANPKSPTGETLEATISSIRELNTSVPSGFVNKHLEYTHGYGAVLAPISENGVNADGTPAFTLQNPPAYRHPATEHSGTGLGHLATAKAATPCPRLRDRGLEDTRARLRRQRRQRGDEQVLGHRWGEGRQPDPPGGLCPDVRGRQLRALRPDHPVFEGDVQPQHHRHGPQGRTVPQVRLRPLLRHPQRQRVLGPGRLHHHGQLSSRMRRTPARLGWRRRAD